MGRRRNSFSGFDGRGRRNNSRQPRIRENVDQPPRDVNVNMSDSYAALNRMIMERLRGRLSGTFISNFGGGNVNYFTYGNEIGGSGGTSVDPAVTEPKPKPEPVTTKPEEPKLEVESAKPDTKPVTEKKPEVLTVKNVSLKISENGPAHRTNKYAISASTQANPLLVIRRGQSFKIDIEFSRPFDEKADDLKIIFEAGDKPLPSKGTYAEFILSAEDKPKEWGAKITSNKESVVSVDVFTPPTCYVGKWSLKIDVIKKEGTDINILRYEHKDQIYVIFNPWCPHDTVYMQDEQLLNEYVLNETGQIYRGSTTNITNNPWNFGQFESCVLDVAFYILDISDINWAVRGNVIPIIRKISAMVNSPDDGGILAGNWSGTYSDGTSPLAWTGSVAILEEFWKSKQAVCYGQCWVFSGVATTICRTLGIPARSVTNFGSAHDTDGSITIDIHFKANGEVDDDATEDSVWNFHVWNECYMSRPDLPPGYGGWQAFDATPQETSDGVYCGGPTSVVAIQNGEVNLPYDAPFVFAEVNADKVFWKPNKLGVLECTYIQKNGIGNFISTKSPNANKRLDITATYKHAEGSPEERAAVLKANQVGSTRHDIYKKTVNDVKFKIIQNPESYWVGASFNIGLSMKNNSNVTRTVSGRIVVETMFYTGVTADKLKSQPFKSIILKPGQEKEEMVEVKQDDYDGKLKDCYMLDVTFLAHVNETDQNFTAKDNYTLNKPHLSVKAPSEIMAGKEFKIDVSFANPLKSSLTGCVLSVDGVCPVIKFPQGNVAPSGTFTATVPITPNKVGKQEIILNFNSVQLEDINTSCPITIRE